MVGKTTGAQNTYSTQLFARHHAEQRLSAAQGHASAVCSCCLLPLQAAFDQGGRRLHGVPPLKYVPPEIHQLFVGHMGGALPVPGSREVGCGW